MGCQSTFVGFIFSQSKEKWPTEYSSLLLSLSMQKFSPTFWVARDGPFEVEWVKLLATGLKRLRMGGIDAILLDLALPDSAGLATFDALYAIASTTPIMTLGSVEEEDLALEVVQRGAQGYLAKGHFVSSLVPQTIRNIIQRKAVEESFYKEKARAEIALNSIGDAVICTDMQGQVDYLNVAAETITGWSKADAYGQSIDKVFNIINGVTRNPERNIVTKCDMCQPRLEAGRTPACVDACPTHAITIEKVNVEAWRLDHTAGDAPALPSADLTLSTTRFDLPEDLPIDAYAASDWNLRPEHPHWSLVWLTLLSQLAVGMTFTADSFAQRGATAIVASIALLGALFHLGRPAVAYKAFRNLRRSWLSREVALLSLYGTLAPITVAAPGVRPYAAAAGAAGVYASARLYMVPGRPAWHTPLTVVRFTATTMALGATATGQRTYAAAGLALAVLATIANWARLFRNPSPPFRGAVRLETWWFRPWTLARFATAIVGALGALLGWPLAIVFVLGAASEFVGRWLFYVAVVPLNMPGAFWRGAAGSHR